MPARIRTRWVADDGRHFIDAQAVRFATWLRDTRTRVSGNSLDTKQCRRLWRDLKCDGAPPRRLTIYVNRQDLDKALLEDMPVRGRA